MSQSTSPLTPGQRVHHPSFGPGRVTEPSTHGTVRVLFSNGTEPLVRTDSLMTIPSGFEPVYLEDGRVSDYARMTSREEFSLEELVLMPSGERVLWIRTGSTEEPWIRVDEARELVQVLQSAIAAAEGEGR